MKSPENPVAYPSETSSASRYLVYAVLRNQNSDTEIISGSKCLQSVELIEVDGLWVAVRAVSSLHQFHDETADRLQDFSNVLTELHRLEDILPFRFGTLIATDELTKFLAPQKETFLRGLDRVAGCTEINIRWAVPAENPVPVSIANLALGLQPTTGLEYLKLKRQSKLRDQSMQLLAEETGTGFQRTLGNDCVAVRSSVRSMKTVSPESDSESIYSIAGVDLLVRRKVHRTIMQSASLILLCSRKPALVSGPWPPFSFIEIGAKSAIDDPILTRTDIASVRLEANA